MKKLIISGLMTLTTFSAQADEQLDQLTNWMQGSFNSAKQAQADESYFNIHLHMKRMWSEDKSSVWLYVEQAAEGYLEKPYRQRVYKVERLGADKFSSKVYSFDEPLKFAGAWKNNAPLSELTPASLKEREGCTVFLAWDQASQGFIGSTKDDECKSKLRGATYATSEVAIYKDRIESWDRGFNAANEHVWGAEKAGYVFDRQ